MNITPRAQDIDIDATVFPIINPEILDARPTTPGMMKVTYHDPEGRD